jgi:DNA-binding NarL/FixJ family response regulator
LARQVAATPSRSALDRRILPTGHDTESYREQCRDLGVDAYLVKSVGRDALIAAISVIRSSEG